MRRRSATTRSNSRRARLSRRSVFWEGTNRRDGRYGGATLKERSRYAAEVLAAMRAAVGDAFPIILRVSQWKQQAFKARLAETPAAMTDWLLPLVEAGADILHCSQRRCWGSRDDQRRIGRPVGDFINVFAGEASTPTSLGTPVARMERGEFDLIAVGRALITDAHWAAKVRAGDGSGLKPFVTDDLATFPGAGRLGRIDIQDSQVS